MAIAFDALGAGSILPGTQITFAHTCTGSNRLLLVGVMESGAATGTISSVTYAGSTMTLFGTVANAGGNLKEWAYYLVNPNTGANNVVVSVSSASDFYRTISASYTGAKQSGQPDNNSGGSVNAGTSLTTSLTPVADLCWNISLIASDNTKSLVASTGVNSVRGNSGSAFYVGDENGSLTPPSSYSMIWTGTTGQNLAAIQTSISPFIVSTRSGYRALLGVGI